jgi:hypothetical protein
VPRAKLISVAVPTRPSVHGRAARITLLTGSNPLLVEVPRLPCSSVDQ